MASDERGREREGAGEAYEPPRVEDVPTDDGPTAAAAGITDSPPDDDN